MIVGATEGETVTILVPGRALGVTTVVAGAAEATTVVAAAGAAVDGVAVWADDDEGTTVTTEVEGAALALAEEAKVAEVARVG